MQMTTEEQHTMGSREYFELKKGVGALCTAEKDGKKIPYFHVARESTALACTFHARQLGLN